MQVCQTDLIITSGHDTHSIILQYLMLIKLDVLSILLYWLYCLCVYVLKTKPKALACARSPQLHRNLPPACLAPAVNTLIIDCTSYLLACLTPSEGAPIQWGAWRVLFMSFSKISVGCCALGEALPRMRMY